jgi:hypothetical protein
MSKQLYTLCKMDDSAGFLHLGRMTRDQAIAETTKHYEKMLNEAHRFLNTPPDKLLVRVQRGCYRVDVIEVLEP